jgi:hypothetical protein
MENPGSGCTRGARVINTRGRAIRHPHSVQYNLKKLSVCTLMSCARRAHEASMPGPNCDWFWGQICILNRRI